MPETVKIVTDEKHPEYRARIVLDEMPHEPEFDGACPIVRLEYFHGWQAETIDLTFSKDAYSKAAAVKRAAAYFFDGGYDGEYRRERFERLERYLRIFHGVTSIDVYESSSQYYIAYDPAESRERWGLDAEKWLAENPGKKIADLGEYRDYLEGNVHGVIVEKADVWVRYGAEGRLEWDESQGSYRTVYAADDIRVEWEEVDACWGFYGGSDDYVSERATEMLEESAS